MTATTNAWCGTRKAIVSRSRLGTKREIAVLVSLVVCVRVLRRGAGTGFGLAGDHKQREAMDPLVVAGQRQQSAHSRRSSKRSRRRVSAAWRSPLSTVRAAARRATWTSCRRSGWRCSSTRRAKRAPGAERRHGHGHWLALWRSLGQASDGSSTLALFDGKRPANRPR